MINLLCRHFLTHFLLTVCGVRIAADRAQDVPHIGADQIGGGHPGADLVIPTDARLCTGMSLHRRAQVPLERADLVALDAKSQGIHHPDQFLGFGIARPRSGAQFGHRLRKLPRLHQIAGLFQFCPNRVCQTNARQKSDKSPTQIRHVFHGLSLSFLLASPALAQTLPAPLTEADFFQFDQAKVKLGRLLFYDKILSGNQNISCASCHHPDLGTTDGVSLGIGEGGMGLGTKRVSAEDSSRIHKRIPRNAPALWNLAYRDLRNMFHDGRLEISDIYGNGFNSPAREWLPTGLQTIMAAQAVLPLTAEHEMAGNPGENEIAGAVKDRIDSGWPIIAKRVRNNPSYAKLFVTAFDTIDSPGQVGIADIANAIAAFIGTEFRNFDSPYDKYLAGDSNALSPTQKRGLDLFFGDAGCSGCHNGQLLTDQGFYALSLPQFGPGRTRAFDPLPRDVGRMGESDRLEDAYKFRTPALRNVALTGPYGHNGAMPTLESMVRHHLNPRQSLASWAPDMAGLPKVAWLQNADFAIRDDRFEMERQLAALDITPVDMSDRQVTDIVAFLHALTGETAKTLTLGVPDVVPSGLPVD